MRKRSGSGSKSNSSRGGNSMSIRKTVRRKGKSSQKFFRGGQVL